MQRVEKCAYQAVPYPLLVLAAHILGFPSCVLSGGVVWSMDQPTPTNGTQLEGPGRPGFQPNVWWSLTRAGSCASSPVALRLLEPTQRRMFAQAR